LVIIGDTHGCIKTLKALVKKLPHRDICLLGDLVDRGPDSAEVVKYVRENNFKTVKGNHEEMMLVANHPNRHFSDVMLWENNGGINTKNSYLKFPKEQMEDDLKWMSTLPLYIEYTNKKGQHYIMSHSNTNYVWDKRESSPKEFQNWALWSREFGEDWADNQGNIGDSINVVGHTVQTGPKRIKNILFLDTGCVFTHSNGYGILTAYDLETNEFYTQENID